MKKRITASFLLWALVSCSNAAQSTPIEVLATLPSASPTLEEVTSPMAEPGEVLDPQGTPMPEWRGIPVMPAAIAGEESGNDNSYSFRANATPTEVQDFYNEALSELGWSQPFDTPFDGSGGRMTFRKEGMSLEIIVMPSEGSMMVLLILTLA